ncbi:MAG: M20/M25/M40 family metallo-hydrolase [Blastocatellia bacterium]|nr:M20/M25/M40 family metallo-hydrolase [Blastocatellia bacterium]
MKQIKALGWFALCLIITSLLTRNAGVQALPHESCHHPHRIGQDPALVLGAELAALTHRKIGRLPGSEAATPTILSQINVQRYQGYIQTLANFGSRYTTSSGCEQAAQYLQNYFQNLGLQTTSQSFTQGVSGRNIIAVLPGTSDPQGTGDFILVGAHYDSISNSNPSTNAPGSEDNASGTAALMELADIFSHNRPQTTLVFAAFSGEEQGLYGSKAYVNSLTTQQRSKLKLALIMDMIGYTADADLDILFETSTQFQAQTALPVSLAQQYTTLRSVISLNPFGSDHIPFINAGLPSVLVIENDWDVYPGYHRTTDVPANISTDMSNGALRVVAAWANELANPVQLPTVTQFYPISSFPGKTISIFGTNFVPGSTQVFFGGTNLIPATVQNVTATRIDVTVPPSTTLTGNINGYLTVQVAGVPAVTTQTIPATVTDQANAASRFPVFVMWGDVTGNGNMEANDFALARAASQGQTTLTTAQILAADVVPVNANTSRGSNLTLGTNDLTVLRAVLAGQTSF